MVLIVVNRLLGETGVLGGRFVFNRGGPFVIGAGTCLGDILLYVYVLCVMFISVLAYIASLYAVIV